MQTINAAGITLIKQFESCKLKAYQVPGDIPTIGWGNTFYQDNTPVKLGDRITQQQADELFAWSLNTVFVPFVAKHAPAWLNENQFAALVSYRYNVRPSTFLGSAILLNIYQKDLQELRQLWPVTTIRPGSKFERGLRRRRRAEVALFFTPVMSNPLPPA